MERRREGVKGVLRERAKDGLEDFPVDWHVRLVKGPHDCVGACVAYTDRWPASSGEALTS